MGQWLHKENIVYRDRKFTVVLKWYLRLSLILLSVSCASMLMGIITVYAIDDEPLLTFFTGSSIWTGALGVIGGAIVFVDWRNMNQNGPPLTTSILVLLHCVFEMICAAFCLFVAIWNGTGCTSQIAIHPECHVHRPSNFTTSVLDYTVSVLLLLICLTIPIFVIFNRNIFGSKSIDERLKDIENKLEIKMNDIDQNSDSVYNAGY
ncbi:hypothetical protein LOTGIDRAFT_171616 [Lottia gigantea]|uniref:MARVEL domain-containing protein n=1 Tax=Lottia gigantea TaxID=225164 RepID=V4B6W0_LOTGI|nr:hypothetical protein LOTGIDRAFT_171616 [Lottia gigantea]ESP03271.1 hypothetical protein LOTGIDRAFT_171616 [Lottia gigantea]